MRQDMNFEAERVQSSVVHGYQLFAGYILEDGFFSLFNSEARLAFPNLLGHPPGYPLFLAALFSIVGKSNFSIQIISIIVSGFSAITIFLLGQKLISRRVGFTAGLLAAFCPQFASNSVLLLPDTLCIFPILLAVYFLTVSHLKPHLLWMTVLSAICLGISCWLRANALLMPLFFAVSMLFLFEKKLRMKRIGVFLIVFILTIMPITIRNAVVYGKFIPISLGAGQTLLEGIADYDSGKKFNIPPTDLGIAQMEARQHNRPDYALSLFGEDGIQRDRMRLRQGFQIIKDNPFWFGGVMLKRTVWMLKLERVLILSKEIPVTHESSEIEKKEIVRKIFPSDLMAQGKKIAPTVQVSGSENLFIIRTDYSKKEPQFAGEIIPAEKYKEYCAKISLRLREGRISVKAQGLESGIIYGSSVLDMVEGKTDQPDSVMQVTFVAARNEVVQLVIFNEPSPNPGSVVEIKNIEVYELGTTSIFWTRPIRLIINSIQQIYLTAVMLPLTIFGLILLINQKKWKPILILGIVPIYYFCVQSALHTEFRYILALHYFFFVAVSTLLLGTGEFLVNKIKISKSKTD